MSVFGVILVCIFPHSDWIRRDRKYLSVFSLHAGKYGHFSHSVYKKESSCDLKVSIVKQHLKDLHFEYIIVLTDKAASNNAFTCQQFYVLVLVKKLGLLNNNTNQTYKQVSNFNLNKNNHSNILRNKFNSSNFPICSGYLNFTRHNRNPGLLLLLHASPWSYFLRLFWKYCINCN